VFALLLPVIALLAVGMYNAVALPGCESCHDTALIEATQASAHASVDCAECHVSTGKADRLTFGYRQLLHMQLPLVEENGREWSAVPDDRCIRCHDEGLEGLINANGITISHEDCAVDAACTDCHSTTAHGDSMSWVRVYDMETCLECHVAEAATACDLCHEGESAADRITSGVFAVTHGADWRETHGMGNAANCVVCHTAAKCETCHGPGLPHEADFIDTHPAYSVLPTAQCLDCHEKTFCSDCHGLAMPHTNAFTRGHAKDAEADPELCQRCHIQTDCDTCHVKHIHPGGAIGTLEDSGSGSAGDQ